MELEELKNSWNKLDKRLAESEIVNIRLVKEMIMQKTKSAHDRIFGINLYNLVVAVLLACLVFPWIYINTPISDISFVIVEIGIVIGLIPEIIKLNLLSEFDIEGMKCNQLSRLVLSYKQACIHEKYWVIAVVPLTMIAFYVSEIVYNEKVNYEFGIKLLITLGAALLTLTLAYFIAQWQRSRHAQQLKEIQQGLEELKEFEQ
ncbi:MAG: hypothetical protein K5893_12510 [Prevotella sp.]|nr:hypothetical protein [Prevotella sp.]